MGSCISTTKTPKKYQQQSPSPLLASHSKHNHFQDRTLVPESDPPPVLPRKSTATQPPKNKRVESHLRFPPPPPPIEEETVKEVLSETPALKSSRHRFQDPPQKILRLPSFPKLEESSKMEEISEISDICSDSISTSALTEQSRDYEEVQQAGRLMDRSPSKIRRKRTDSGESPVRMVGNLSSRQWNVNQSGGVVRDQGESSRRRSRSPVTRVDSGVRGGMCRSPSGKRGGRAAGRSPVASEIGRNFDESREGKRPVRESLEDPLVSLECFIFL